MIFYCAAHFLSRVSKSLCVVHCRSDPKLVSDIEWRTTVEQLFEWYKKLLVTHYFPYNVIDIHIPDYVLNLHPQKCNI